MGRCKHICKHMNLYWGQVLLVEVGLGLVDIVAEAAANLSVNETALDIVPVLVVDNVVLQPVREVSEAVLFVAAAGDCLAYALVGHHQSEQREADEAQDEQEQDGQVDVHHRVDPAAGADESQNGHYEEEDTHHQERVLDRPLALGVAAVEPEVEGDGHGGDADHQRAGVEEAYYGVAYPAKHHRSKGPLIQARGCCSKPKPNQTKQKSTDFWRKNEKKMQTLKKKNLFKPRNGKKRVVFFFFLSSSPNIYLRKKCNCFTQRSSCILSNVQFLNTERFWCLKYVQILCFLGGFLLFLGFFFPNFHYKIEISHFRRFCQMADMWEDT